MESKKKEQNKEKSREKKRGFYFILCHNPPNLFLFLFYFISLMISLFVGRDIDIVVRKNETC
jgi:hypothetical protein